MLTILLFNIISAQPISTNLSDRISIYLCDLENMYYPDLAAHQLEEAWIKWQDTPTKDLMVILGPLDMNLEGTIMDQKEEIMEKAFIIQVLRLRGFEGVDDPLILLKKWFVFTNMNPSVFQTSNHYPVYIIFWMAKETLLELEYGIETDTPDYAGLLSAAEGYEKNRCGQGSEEAIVVQRLLLRQDPGFLEYVNKALAEREETDSEPRIWQIIREERTDRKLQHNRGQMLDRLTLMRERKAAGLSPELPPVGP